MINWEMTNKNKTIRISSILAKKFKKRHIIERITLIHKEK